MYYNGSVLDGKSGCVIFISEYLEDDHIEEKIIKRLADGISSIAAEQRAIHDSLPSLQGIRMFMVL